VNRDMKERPVQGEHNEMELCLPTPPGFSFTQNINYLSRSPLECLYEIEGPSITRALLIEHEPVLIRVDGSVEGCLTIQLLQGEGRKRARTRTEIAEYVREWFDLERDLQPFYEIAGQDSILRGAVNDFRGLRVMGIPDLFEALAWGIIGQQINLPFAYRLKRRLVEKYGQAVTRNGRTYLLFPPAETIAGLTVQEMEDMQLTVKKREYLIGVAGLIASGQLSKRRLQDTGSMKEAERMLIGIRGIGPWTANYVLMRCLRFPAAFPVDDVGLHLAIKSVLGINRKPTKQEVITLASAWKGWEAYAVFYLWRLLY
jgi:DNA-3-methyladenine glycosylase II